MGTILVTGGAGYIGSHVCLAVAEAGHDVVVVDNLVNGSATAVERVGELTGASIELHVVDVTDRAALDRALDAHDVDAAIHLAGLKSVGESMAEPLRYYDVNINAAISLIGALERHGVFRLVFSSSATVYGEPDGVPIPETARRRSINPYGRTKQLQEDLFFDVAAADPRWHIGLLRYFNPVGAHPSGRIGEDPAGTPNNLMPYLMQVAVGRRDDLTVFGDDYPTPDGTCIRDYLHVVDLADGHVAALDALDDVAGCRPWNLGTGEGYSVLEVIGAASRAIGRPVPHEVGPRRPGDVPELVADVTRAQNELGWRAERDLAAMCADHWRWQQQNPDGYRVGA
ncbi:MAG: UDP-glucose 4-epimerase GalE [Acidimicrobiia bacterium]|nr:UDP-glucose 4-epimerase GalE [Acidimicrobiia bacterium]